MSQTHTDTPRGRGGAGKIGTARTEQRHTGTARTVQQRRRSTREGRGRDDRHGPLGPAAQTVRAAGAAPGEPLRVSKYEFDTANLHRTGQPRRSRDVVR